MEESTINHLLIVVGVLGGLLIVAPGLIWLERRLLALWQDRYGPNRAGPFGVLIVLADTIKLFFKEDWIPPFADKVVFVIAPAIVMVSVFLSFVIVPFAPGIIVADLNIGILFFLAMSSMGAYSIILGGWASYNKYSLLGAMRGAAQMISYEVFMGLALMGTVLLSGSFSLVDIVEAQRGMWSVIQQFVGVSWFLILAVHLFFCGWLGPGFVPRLVLFVLKTFAFIGLFILLRASLPRPRYDQLMEFGWKILLPVTLINLLVTAGIVLMKEG